MTLFSARQRTIEHLVKLSGSIDELGGPRHRGSGVARASDGVGILLLAHILMTGTCIAPSSDPGCTYVPCRVVPFVTDTKDVKVRRTLGGGGHHSGWWQPCQCRGRLEGWAVLLRRLPPEILKPRAMAT